MMKRIYFIFTFIVGIPLFSVGQEYLQADSAEIEMKTREINIGKRKISLTILNKKETKEIISLYKGNEDIQLSKKYNGHIFILNDGRLILSHEGGGALYQSSNDIEDYKRFIDKESLKSHPLEDGIPYGIAYLKHIDTIISEFSQKLEIPLVQLDKTIGSLKVIDQKLKKLKLDEFQLEKEYLIYLMTYCGEVIRNNVGGNWVLNELMMNNKHIYEPIIRVRENRDYTPLWSIYEEIMERPKTFSLAIAIGAEIEKYKLLDAMLNKNNKK